MTISKGLRLLLELLLRQDPDPTLQIGLLLRLLLDRTLHLEGPPARLTSVPQDCPERSTALTDVTP